MARGAHTGGALAEQRRDLVSALGAAFAVRVERVFREEVDERVDLAVIQVVRERRVQVLDREADLDK